MHGVLIESRPARQHRAGGAALSLAAHIAIAALVSAGAATQVSHSVASTALEALHFVPPAPPTPAHVRVAAAGDAPTLTNVPVTAPVKPTIDVVDVGAPPITSTMIFSQHGVPPVDSFSLGPNGASSGHPRGILDGGNGDGGASTLRGRDLLMRIVRMSKPRYPESLRQSGVDGTVLVRFVVDTTGRIEPSSVVVLSSTHPLFTRAVLDALGNFRFKPTEVDGRLVEAAAEMPFEFSIAGATRSAGEGSTPSDRVT